MALEVRSQVVRAYAAFGQQATASGRFAKFYSSGAVSHSQGLSEGQKTFAHRYGGRSGNGRPYRRAARPGGGKAPIDLLSRFFFNQIKIIPRFKNDTF